MNSPTTNTLSSDPTAAPDDNRSVLPDESDSDLWTTERVAKYLHVSLKTVFNLRKKGLPYVHLGGAVRFVPQEIKDYLTNSRRLSSHRLRQMVRTGASL